MLFNSYNKPVGCDFIPILELRKLRLRRAKALAQGLTDGSNRGAHMECGPELEIVMKGSWTWCSAEYSEQDAFISVGYTDWLYVRGPTQVVP